MIRWKNLIPLMFQANWESGWSAHQVCCAKGIAYEPLFSQPVALEEYCQLMFGEDIPMTAIVPPEEIRAFVNRI